MRATTAVSAYYFFLFGGIGVFWPVYVPFLEKLGLSPAEAATILALNPLMGLGAPILTGLLADALRARVWILRLLSAGAAIAFAGWLVTGRARPLIWGVAIVYAICRAPLSALADASAFEAVRRAEGSFGRVRLWGSVGFFFAAILGGALFEHVGHTAMVLAAVAGLAVAAAFTWTLPAPPVGSEPRAFAAWVSMLRAADLWPYLGAVFLGYVANAALDACFSAYLERLGAGATWIALAWAVGVVAEVALMWRSRELIARWGADRVLVFALAVATLRWVLIGSITSRPILLALQPLHGITFGCLYVAGATIVRDRAPAEAPTAAQGMFNAAAAAGSALGMVLAGRAFERWGGAMLFLGAAAVAGAGALAAIAHSVMARRASVVSPT